MFYRLLRAFLTLCLRIFYRRIETPGLESVPGEGPLILVANHGSALMDPLLVLVLLPRPVSFLAKHTLFSMPVVGFVLRRIGGIPVHRRQDSTGEASGNEAMFAACRAVLDGGGVVCLFPEGISHDRPRLEPLKTGAARIYLRNEGQPSTPIRIIPVGINFEEKRTFRSRVLVVFGRPVDTQNLDRATNGLADSVTELTFRIERDLGSLLPGLDSWEELEFIRGIEQLVLRRTGGSLAGEAPALRRFIDAYQVYRRIHPRAVQEVRDDWEAYGRQLARFSLTDSQVALAGAPARAARSLLFRAAVTLLVMPLAVLGFAVNFVPYQLCGFIERRVNRHPDQSATVKLLTGLAVFPATYIVLLLVAVESWGFGVAAVLLFLLPVAGWAALIVGENHRRIAESLGALVLLASPVRARQAIRRQRERLLERVEALIRAEASPAGAFSSVEKRGSGR